MSSLKQFNPSKILQHLDRVNDFFKGKNVYPVTVEIDPSNVCNHDCVWCTFEHFRGKSNAVMPEDMLRRTLGELKENGVKAIVWTGGGEPMTNKCLFPVMDFAHNLGLEMGTFTNGALLNETNSRQIVEQCKFIRVSLDAATGDTHARLHRPRNSEADNFYKILENLSRLVQLKKKSHSRITIGTSFLVNDENFHEIYQAAKLVKELGVDYFQIKPVVIFDGTQLDTSIFIKAQPFIMDAEAIAEKGFDVFSLDYKFKDLMDPEHNYGRQYTECLGHSFIGTIGADGEVYLCCHLRGLPEYSFGNLHEKSYVEIWDGAQRQEAIRRIDFKKCQPLCKAHEINKILHYIKYPERHSNFL